MLRSPFGEVVEVMMNVSSSMAALGARQLAAVFGENTSRQAVGAALRLLRQSAEAAGTALPGEAGLEWRELANKLEAFDGFQEAGPASGQTSGLGAYRSLWTAEGLGYAHARSAWTAGEPPRGLLTGGGWTAGTAVPLHTGAALWFAGRLLDAGEDRSTAGLERWLARWESNARPGSGDLAVEALGLMARNLYPHRLPRIAECLRSIEPALDEPFWHGVGRGLYFAPTHALPWSGATGRAFEKAWREPPHEAGRINATAGLAWALTLVNLRHPEVLAEVLEHWSGEIGSAEAFANGVASAVLIWYGAAGRDLHLDHFLGNGPETSGRRAARWHELVTAPCETALRETWPRLRQGNAMAELFRFRSSAGQGAPGS